MNKEQLKKSILELVSYYTGNIVQLNSIAREVLEDDNQAMYAMINVQADAARIGFEKALDVLLVDDEEEEEAPSES